MLSGITVLKLGGELLEGAAAVRSVAGALVRLAGRGPLVVVHGGGRAIDAELRERGLTPRFADGLRVTDEPTLEAVISVLAGRTNTALVAAVVAAGGHAIGLTGADGSIALCRRAPAVRTRTGELVDLGLVGEPIPHRDVRLLRDLLKQRWIPVVASIGIGEDGGLLNVNADLLASSLAVAFRADRLIVAGFTPGVLGDDGRPVAVLNAGDIARMAATGIVHSGMIAKLTACHAALAGGVPDVAIVDGRSADDFTRAPGTRLRGDSTHAAGAGEVKV